MIGTKIKLKTDFQICRMIEEKVVLAYQQERCDVWDEAIKNIAFNKKTQGGPGLKLRLNFLCPYKVVNSLRNDRYVVERFGDHEEPFRTSNAADNMNQWPSNRTAVFNFGSESDNSDSD